MRSFFYIVFFSYLTVSLTSTAWAFDLLKQAATVNCNIKPIPQPGCTIGACVNGQWQQNCSSSLANCGPKPPTEPGCKIENCINNHWQQVCAFPDKSLQCGVKPIPEPGCSIGECIQGHWQQTCP